MSYGLCDEPSGVRHKQQQLAAKDFSAGVIAYYWCVNKRLDMLCHHNVFLSGTMVLTALKRSDLGTRCPHIFLLSLADCCIIAQVLKCPAHAAVHACTALPEPSYCEPLRTSCLYATLLLLLRSACLIMPYVA
jgi:hypothetical protein